MVKPPESSQGYKRPPSPAAKELWYICDQAGRNCQWSGLGAFFFLLLPPSPDKPLSKSKLNQLTLKVNTEANLPKQLVHLQCQNGYNGPACIIYMLCIFGRKSVNWAHMHWLFLTHYTWWHLLTLKVLLTAEIRKTCHVKAVVAASNSDCVTWQAWKSLLDSVGCQNIGNLMRLTEEFVGRELKDFWLLN